MKDLSELNDVVMWETDYTEDEQKEYLLYLLNNNDFLKNRIGHAFTTKPWLTQYTSKDDIMQDVYLRVFKPSGMKGILSKKGVDRIKYINSVITNSIFKSIRKYIEPQCYLLTEELEVNNYNALKQKECDELSELFMDETIERYVCQLLKDGMTDKEIKEILSISRTKLKDIKHTIKTTIELENATRGEHSPYETQKKKEGKK